MLFRSVFADYDLGPSGATRRLDVLGAREALVFSLGGLSKTIGLPQAKLAWLACGGPGSLVSAAIDRLEIAADTYLSVSTPVQLAAADLLERGAAVRAQIQQRIVSNYQWLAAATAGASACRVLAADGGWYAIMHVPTLSTEEELVMKLLTVDGVLVHPGYFFDFPTESYLVASLLVHESAFREGVARVLRHFDGR